MLFAVVGWIVGVVLGLTAWRTVLVNGPLSGVLAADCSELDALVCGPGLAFMHGHGSPGRPVDNRFP